MLTLIATLLLSTASTAQASAGICRSLGGVYKTSVSSYLPTRETSMCGYPDNAETENAIIVLAQPNGAYCGACIQVTGPAGTGVFRITEVCPESACGKKEKIMLSPRAFQRITGREHGRETLRWQYTACPETMSKIQYRMTLQTLPYFLSFQVLNPRYVVSRVEVNTTDGYLKATPNLAKSFFVSGRIVEPVQIRIIDVNGSVITDTLPDPRLLLEPQDTNVRLPNCIPAE